MARLWERRSREEVSASRRCLQPPSDLEKATGEWQPSDTVTTHYMMEISMTKPRWAEISEYWTWCLYCWTQLSHLKTIEWFWLLIPTHSSSEVQTRPCQAKESFARVTMLPDMHPLHCSLHWLYLYNFYSLVNLGSKHFFYRKTLLSF